MFLQIKRKNANRERKMRLFVHCVCVCVCVSKWVSVGFILGTNPIPGTRYEEWEWICCLKIFPFLYLHMNTRLYIWDCNRRQQQLLFLFQCWNYAWERYCSHSLSLSLPMASGCYHHPTSQQTVNTNLTHIFTKNTTFVAVVMPTS